MRATASQTDGDTRPQPARADEDRDRARPEPPPRDASGGAQPRPAVHRDDGSHTPPHGDAVLPHPH